MKHITFPHFLYFSQLVTKKEKDVTMKATKQEKKKSN